MSTINDLSVAASVSSDDKIPLWQNANGVTRALPVSVLDGRYLTQEQIALLPVSPKDEIFISDALPNPEGYPTFTAGSTHALTLANQYYSAANLKVHFDTGFQGSDTYTLNGYGLAFVDPNTQDYVPIPVGIEKVYVSGGAARVVSAPSDGTVGAAALVDEAVTTPKLADDAVTAPKLASGAVVDASVASGTQLANRINGIVIDARDAIYAGGVKADGVTDDSAAAQAAINAGGPGATIVFPAGTVLLSKTLNAFANQRIIGKGVNATTFRRFSDYGDTLSFADPQAGHVSGIWFFHGHDHSVGDTSLDYRVTSNSAHVRVGGTTAQGFTIDDCWFWRMPYGISIDRGALIKIYRCNFIGTWDDRYTAAQEGVAGVQIGAVGYTEIVAIEQCYFSGTGSGPSDVTFTSSDTGAHTFNFIRNTGSQYAIKIVQCEDLIISNNYIGGNNVACIFAQLAAGSANLDWRITGNFLDGAGLPSTGIGSMIFLTSLVDGPYVNGVTIANNVFNGEMITYQAITAYNGNGSSPVVTNFAITGNTFQAIAGSAVMLYAVRGGVVSGNSVTGYNARGISNGADINYSCGIFFGANSHNVLVTGNVVGGVSNTGTAPAPTFIGIYTDGTDGSIIERDNFILGGGTSGAKVGRVDARIVTFTAAGNYTCLGHEDVVVVNKTTGAATQVVLPPNVPIGYAITIKDGKGDAATNSVQIGGTVDGTLNPVVSTNYFSRKLLWNGAQWNVIASS